MNATLKAVVLWAVLLIVIALAWNFATIEKKETPLRFSEFMERVEGGRVQDVTIAGDEIRGRGIDGYRFRTYAPAGYDRYVETLLARKVAVAVERNQTPAWAAMLISWAPFILLIGFWVFSMRQMQSRADRADRLRQISGGGDLTERTRIAETINTLFVATDARDWGRVRDVFAGQVLFDMTSLAGGEASQMTPEAIATAWETGLASIERVHHQTGNLSIGCSATEAAASCYGIAYHYRRTKSGRNTRVFVGSYDFHLRRVDTAWRIDVFRFNSKFVDGNLELEKEPPA